MTAATTTIDSYGGIDHRQIAGLYTACDCYVQPYRGEGFGLPIAEAMATGLPVIVTGQGAALDFCDEDRDYFIPAEIAPVPLKLWDEHYATVQPPTWYEPDKAALRRLMRRVLESREEARDKGARASAHILGHYTWEHTVETMIRRMTRFQDASS